MKRVALALLVGLLALGSAQAQVTVVGPVTPGNCVAFNSVTVLRDAGPCTGAVIGPSTPTTDNALARWDGTTGRLLQNSNAVLSDPGELTLQGGAYIGGQVATTPFVGIIVDVIAPYGRVQSWTGSAAARLNINPGGGNVNIGTTSDFGSALGVNGAVFASGLVVNTTQVLGGGFIQPLNIFETISGGSLGVYGIGNQFRIIDGSIGSFDGINVYYQTTTNWRSPKNAVNINAVIGADYTGALTNNAVVALQTNAQGAVAIAGGSARGDNITLFSLNPWVWNDAGSGPFYAIVGAEFDLGIATGTVVKQRIGIQVMSAGPQNPMSPDLGLRGTERDSAYVVGAGVHATGSGVTWGRGWEWYPDTFNNTSYIMKGGLTAALSGIDLTDATFDAAGCSFTSNLFCVKQTGLTIIGDPTASGLTTLNAQFSTNAQVGSSLVARKSFTGVNGPAITQIKSRGTAAAPVVVVSGDNLGSNAFFGYDGNAYQQAAVIQIKVDGTPGVGDMPGRIELQTTPDGAAASLLRAAVFNNGGFNVGSSTTSPGVGIFNVEAGYSANGSAGLSATKTVRASGGAADCTLIYTFGLLTGGSC